MKSLKRRALEISYEHKLSHLGSVLTSLPIIDEIFKTKKADEKFVLSMGHAGLALYVVLEKYGHKNAEDIYLHHGTHPDRCSDCGINCSSGSLGHGIGIALGMALADRSKKVFTLISDGECSEGSVWEAIRVWKRERVKNLKIYLNFNGYSAYKETYLNEMPSGVKRYVTNYKEYPFLNGINAHYYTMKKEDLESCIR